MGVRRGGKRITPPFVTNTKKITNCRNLQESKNVANLSITFFIKKIFVRNQNVNNCSSVPDR